MKKNVLYLTGIDRMNRIVYFSILPTKDTKMAKFHSFLFACFVGNMLLLHFVLVW